MAHSTEANCWLDLAAMDIMRQINCKTAESPLFVRRHYLQPSLVDQEISRRVAVLHGFTVIRPVLVDASSKLGS
jgi:hypothetical protein